jgi:hypothetical protein
MLGARTEFVKQHRNKLCLEAKNSMKYYKANRRLCCAEKTTPTQWGCVPNNQYKRYGKEKSYKPYKKI